MYDKKSGLNYLQRHGFINIGMNPEPRIEPSALTVHKLSLEAPLPLPKLLYFLNGEPTTPDRGRTLEWPHKTNETI